MKFFTKIIVYIFLFFAQGVYASSLGGISVKPLGEENWFVYSYGPGQSGQDSFVVTNHSDEEKTVEFFAVDKKPDFGKSFVLKKIEDSQEFIGSWVEIDEKEAFLLPGESREVFFTIRIPELVDVGEHAGAIIVRQQGLILPDGQKSPFADTSLGVRVYNTVPGEKKEKISIQSFRLSPNASEVSQKIILQFKNTGNSFVVADTDIVIDGFGLYKKKNSLQWFRGENFEEKFSLSRSQEAKSVWEWEKPYFGFYKLQGYIQLGSKDSEYTVETELIRYSIVPWVDISIGILALILLLIVMFAIIKLRKKRYMSRGWRQYRITVNDNIISLSEKYGIDWEELAKINKIKKPYALIPGKLLLIPSRMHDEENNQEAVDPMDRPRRRGFAKILLIFTALLLGVFVVVMAGFLYVQYTSDDGDETDGVFDTTEFENNDLDLIERKDDEDSQVEEVDDADAITEEDVVEEVIEDVMEVVRDPSDVRIQILNGSGVTGFAGKMEVVINGSGFTQTSTRNADNFDYKNLSIFYQDETYKKSAEEIKKALSSQYPKATVEKGDLKDYNIMVVLGSAE